MAVQRVLTDTERTRRGAGWVLTVLGLGALGFLGWAVAQAGAINVPTAILMAIPAALAVLGLRLALRRKLVVLIDREARTYVLVRSGSPDPPRPLDQLAPLLVTMRQREVKTKNGTRTITEYAVHASGEAGLDFHVVATPAEARRRLERLARDWRLSCRSLGGDLRRADQLDRPLHERRKGDVGVSAGPALLPDWRLEVRPLSPGWEIVSRHRSWLPLVRAGLIVGPVVFGLVMVLRAGLREMTRSLGVDLGDRVFAGLLAVVVLALVVELVKGARDTFFPGTVRITPDGVRYRGTRMPLNDIEEVIVHGGIEVVGDRKTLSIPSFFYPTEAGEALAREVTRRIVEMGPYAPMR